MNKKIRVQAWRAQRLWGLLMILSTSVFSQTMDENFIQRYPSDVQRAYLQAKQLVCQKKYTEAKQSFARLVRHDFSLHAPFWKWYIRVYSATGDYDSAIFICRRMMKADTLHALPYYWKGLSYFYEMNYDEGLPFLRKAKMKLPQPDDLLEGLIQFGEGHKQQALASFTRHIAKQPRDSIAYYYRSLIYTSLLDEPHAYSDYTTLYAIDSLHSLSMNRHVCMLQAKGQYQQAFAYVHAHANKMPSMRYLRGATRFFLNQMNAALGDFHYYNSRFPNVQRVQIYMAFAHSSLRSYDSALYYFKRVINAPSIDYTVRDISYIYLTGFYYNQGDYEKALLTIKKAVEVSEQKQDLYQYFVGILFKRNEPEEAEKYYRLFIGNRPWVRYDSITFALLDAAKALTKNETKRGIALLNQAEQLYNRVQEKNLDYIYQFELILYWRGFAALAENNCEKAIQYFEQSLLILPDQKPVAKMIAECQQKLAAIQQNKKRLPLITLHHPVVRSESEKVPLTMGQQVIKGSVKHASGIATVMVNNISVPLKNDSTFEYSASIAKGLNMLSVVALSRGGEVGMQNIVIEGIEKTEEIAPIAMPQYHAVLIAESSYLDSHLSSLNGPKQDLKKMYKVLTERYSFTPHHVDTLVNVSRLKILETLIKRANMMSEKENLLVFYAGHGTMKKNPDNSEEGYLVPSDAEVSNIFSLISRENLTHCFKYSKAKHILFIADACFSGTLFRSAPVEDNMSMSVVNAYKDRSRRLLASGNRSVVYDESDFVENFRLQLQENKDKYVTAEMLVSRFKQQYENESGLSLQYYPMKDTGDYGGHFVFVQN